jgi:hypothetical protein
MRENIVTGVIENMPAEARMERMRILAAYLVEIVRQNGAMKIMDALNAIATKLRTAVSQVKYGLNYALSNSLLRLDADDRLVAA